ncbi:hypothetical protein CPLU01_02656 [Colletotrichum plurivorum]|uniref:Uncharacterized protein n=1 Tax=Colletotrichum plurivorum TaxID=2175906 RepID=A0A8H6KVH9_9PEZI|nr:hypothetical protein CPLU01_02656 [Colletotrichum plurivorum]
MTISQRQRTCDQLSEPPSLSSATNANRRIKDVSRQKRPADSAAGGGAARSGGGDAAGVNRDTVDRL